MGVEDIIREAFNEAKAYKAEWDEYGAEVARGEHPIPPRKDLKLEPLKEVLEGKRVRPRALLPRRRDPHAAARGGRLRLQDPHAAARAGRLQGGQGDRRARSRRFHFQRLVVRYKMEAFDAIPYNAAIMQKKGVLVSLNSDDAELMRHLNSEAAKAMKYGGVSETEALAMVTINPAKQLGIDNRVGSIEVGKDADLVIYDKYPALGLRQGAEGADRRPPVFRPRQRLERPASEGSWRSRS